MPKSVKYVVAWGAIATIVLILGAGAWGLSTLRDRARLAQARKLLLAGRITAARSTLVQLTERYPGWGSAAYLLGNCEQARGQAKAALQAWAGVPADSPLAAPAVINSATLLADEGHLAKAEAALLQGLEDPRRDAFALRRMLAVVCRGEGRDDEAVRNLELGWEVIDGTAPDAIENSWAVVRQRRGFLEDSKGPESTRALLARAGRLAPDDDRVWLGKACLATSQGEFDDAALWLARCLSRRPNDSAVWRAKLALAIGAERPDDAIAAMSRLSNAEFRPAQAWKLAAWLAAQRDDRGAEERALQAVLWITPGDSASLERLIALTEAANQTVRTAELREKKSRIEQLHRRYKALLERDQPVRDAAQLADLAEQLGDNFEAKAFVEIALRTGDRTEELLRARNRLTQKATAVALPGRTLAQAVAALSPPTISDAPDRPTD